MAKFKQLKLSDDWKGYLIKYPKGYTILENLIDWLSQTNKLVDNVNDWNEYLDDFVENFDKRLEPHTVETLYKMADDGTLDRIINENIFEDLNNEITALEDNLNESVGELTSDLNNLYSDYEYFKNETDRSVSFLEKEQTLKLDNLDELREIDPPDNNHKLAFVSGVGDGHSTGYYYFDSESTSNSPINIRPNQLSETESGRWIKIISDHVTPEMFGAVGDGVANDYEPLQKFLDFLSDGEWLGFMKNTYYVSSGELFAYGSPRLIMTPDSEIVTGDSVNVAIRWGNVDKILINARIDGLKVRRLNPSLDGSNVGFWYGNVANCLFQNYIIDGYSFGEYLRPVSGERVGYNTFINPFIRRCRRSTFILPHDAGWANENNWFGGRWQASSSAAPFEYHIRIDQTGTGEGSPPNHNRFYGCSFEGTGGETQGTGINAINIVVGRQNVFFYCRTEGTWEDVHVLMLARSNDNIVYVIRTETTCRLNGSRNYLYTHYKIYNEAGEVLRRDGEGNVAIRGRLSENAEHLDNY